MVAAAVRAFEGLGYPVEEVDPGWGDHTEMEHCIWTTMIAGNAGPYVARWREHMDPGLVACIEEGHRYSAVDFFAFRAERNACYQQVRKFFERYDLLLTPTLSVAALPRRAAHSRTLGAAPVGLDPVGRVLLSLQPDLDAGRELPVRLHRGRTPGGAADRGGAFSGPAGAPGLARVRAGISLAVAPPPPGALSRGGAGEAGRPAKGQGRFASGRLQGSKASRGSAANDTHIISQNTLA